MNSIKVASYIESIEPYQGGLPIKEVARKLNIADLKGASFSISSLGAIGGKFFTPIINPPEVAILGISKSYEKVISSKAGFEGRSFLPISLSYDHRAINGVYAVQFTSQLAEALSDRKLIEKSFK